MQTRSAIEVRPLLRSALLATLLFSTAALAETARFRVVWSGDPSTSATIGWDQLEGDNPVLYYGTKDVDGDPEKFEHSMKPTRNVPNYRGMNNMFVSLENLEADQKYYFVVKDSQQVSYQFWFRTAPDKPKAFTFVAGGDTKSYGSALVAGRESNMMTRKLRPLFVLFSGDFNSGSGLSTGRWQQWFDDWFLLTTTDDNRLTPIVPVHGNHEDGDKTVLHNLFDVPYQGDNQENIYFDTAFGNFFSILALNSQIKAEGAQTEWLEKNLKKYEGRTFKVAAYHKPFFPHTTRKRENQHLYDLWANLFFTHGLDLSFDADSHISKMTFPIRPSDEEGSHMGFIRDDKKGTMYIGEGSWGAGPRSTDDLKPWTLRAGAFNQVKWLHVFPEQDGKPARIDIRTVITAKENEAGLMIPYSHEVVPLKEGEEFNIPEGIELFNTEPYGDVISYPFSE
jgi:hypothetical protein